MTMIARERLLLTADKSRLVRDGDPEGKTLYCTPGTEIPDSAVKLFGLVDGHLGKAAPDPASGTKEAKPRPDKEKQPGGDKEKAPGDDKGAGSGTKGAAASAGDDLTQIKFVGTKVAAGFVAAGLTSFAQIAAIDAAQPPEVAGTNATTKWEQIVESAKALVAAAGDDGDTDKGDDKDDDEKGDGGAGDSGADAGTTGQKDG
jgi:predicted flap endonuclease-1-like 5' DNA nuclease